MRKLVIFGIRNFAEIASHFFSTDSDFEVVGFTVDGAYIDESTFMGKPVVAFENLEQHFPPSDHHIFVAIGINGVNRKRAEKLGEAQNKGYQIASFVHSTAYVHPPLALGPNTMIMDNVVLHPKVRIGFNTVIWSCARIALKCEIGNHCWITSAFLGESIRLGDYSFVGLNATLAPFIKVGNSSVIGAGAVVQQDLGEASVVKAPQARLAKFTSDRLRNFQ